MSIIKPLIGITLGDAAGIGPEIILKAVSDKMIQDKCRLLIIGDSLVFQKTADSLKLPYNYPICYNVPGPCTAPVTVLDFKLFKKFPKLGKVQKECGTAAVRCIEAAVDLAINGYLAGIVTAPLNKEILKLAGCPHPGHTEFLAELTQTKNFGMAFAGGGLRLILTTIHEPVSKLPKLITPKRVYTSILLAHRAAQELGIVKPKIGVAGLNPHAGENGLFGKEEFTKILPAIKKARQNKINVHGPIAPDTLFYRARQGDFDFVVAMYHDQGLIPIKTLDFYGGVNITIGLPIVRTSPDHGTAYDIAGEGIANPDSMKAAILLAVDLARNRGLI